MPDVTPNGTPDKGTDPEGRRPADDRTRTTKRVDTGLHGEAVPAGEAVPTGEALRSGEAGGNSATGLHGEAASTGEAGRTGTAGPRGAGGSTADAAPRGASTAARSDYRESSGGVGPSGEAVVPGGKSRTSSAEPRGTTLAGEPTPFGTGAGAGADAGADAGTDRAARGPASGARRDDDALRASDEDGAPPRHREAGSVHTGTVAGRVPTTAAAESGGHGASLLPVDSGGHGASLLPVDECDRIASRMRHAVVGFVDGPRDSVAEADQVLEELAARFTDAVDRRRRTLRGSWQSAEGAKDTEDAKDRATTPATAVDTEQLRLALRDYRELTERLLHL